MGPTHREEVAERDVREDLVGSVPGALTLALSPELLQSFQQGARGAEEKGILLGDGVIQRRVIAMTAQPAREQNRAPQRQDTFPAWGGQPLRSTATLRPALSTPHKPTASPLGEAQRARGLCGHGAAPGPHHVRLSPRPKTKTGREGGLVFKRSLGARKSVENMHISFCPTSN